MVAEGPALRLVRRLELLLVPGRMHWRTRRLIAASIEELSSPEERLQLALYLIVLSADAAISN